MKTWRVTSPPRRASCPVRGKAKRRQGLAQPRIKSGARKGVFPEADRVTNLEGNTARRVIASGGPVQRGQRPQHAWTLLAREPGDLVTGQGGSAPPVRVGEGSNP